MTDRKLALLTDQYALTMVQGYWRERMFDNAVFSLFVRRLPEQRNFLVACGLADVLDYIETLRYEPEALEYLHGRDEFEPEFLDWLESFRFTGQVRAVPEGTVVFENEPILEVRAPLPEGQLLETYLMNQIHLQTVLASKAARVVLAAQDRPVVDFGLRRMHGADAGLKAARAFHIAGVAATSNVLAGEAYGVPVTGTMGHSYIQAHGSEMAAFRAFATHHPAPVLLVDTYDTLAGVRKVVQLAREMGDAFRVRAIRLDSGDMGALAVEARRILDEDGLEGVEIFVSGGLDEYEIARLLGSGAPIDGFGVGTGMGVSSDAPSLDMAYKLAEYGGRGRLKLSTGKPILPGEKQVFRREENGLAAGDVIGRVAEDLPGRPLLESVMKDGHRLPTGQVSLEAARERAANEIRALPNRLRQRERAESAYPVEISPALKAYQREVTHQVQQETEAVT